MISVRNVLTFAGLYLVYHVLKAIYNVSPLHPLSRIPGPKLAAATYWPEFYYDVVKFGCYTKEIAKMHERYGKLEVHQSSRDAALTFGQARLFASTPTKCIAMTSRSRMRSMLSADANATSRCTRSMAQRRPP